ncbi:hypothetical protein jhhlp_000692 [Lomentospora prolificans]|uniref:Thioester reductase (TE) domain-containing protein n=1 Tax=Lomentospora prolificans TaxID=41688 RepID=A0A2N3NJ58_9PEZI|nr:hypothetical protein jhhlp_000692 [Lomentospora prolificans]
MLGLSESEFSHLADTAHAIIHNGADVSFMKTYASLRRPNVLSTRVLAEMALSRGIPFHFISTASVALFACRNDDAPSSLPEVSVASHIPPPDATANSGYAASKWVGEVLLEKIFSDFSLQTWIHRPTSVVGDGAPATDMIPILLRYSKMIGAVPKTYGMVSGVFDFIHVEKAVDGVVECALGTGGSEQDVGKVRFVHHCNPRKVEPAGFRRYMEKSEGNGFEELSMEEWVEKAKEAGLEALVYDFLKHALDQGMPIQLPVIHRG